MADTFDLVAGSHSFPNLKLPVFLRGTVPRILSIPHIPSYLLKYQFQKYNFPLKLVGHIVMLACNQRLSYAGIQRPAFGKYCAEFSEPLCLIILGRVTMISSEVEVKIFAKAKGEAHYNILFFLFGKHVIFSYNIELFCDIELVPKCCSWAVKSRITLTSFSLLMHLRALASLKLKRVGRTKWAADKPLISCWVVC